MSKTKDRIGFIGAMMVTVSVFLAFAVFVREGGPFFLHRNSEDISPILDEFIMRNRPLVEVNFSELYGGNGQFQILHPILNFSNLDLKNKNPICHVEDVLSQMNSSGMNYESDRLEYGEESIQSAKLNWKSEAIENLRNKQGGLPVDFIQTPPYFDKWGSSFAFLLTESGALPYSEKSWAEQHLPYFKVSELAKILTRFQISDLKFKTISKLNEVEIENLVRGEPLVLTNDYLLIKNNSKFGFSPLSYWIFSIQDFRAYLAGTEYDLSPYTTGALCLTKMGNGCWIYNSKRMMSYLFKYSIVVIFLIGIIVLICLIFYFRSVYQKNKQQKRSRLALQVLSHEFRTPVSSMLLMLDSLSKRSQHFEIEDQDSITRISAEIFRLQRIVEMSRTYLQTESQRIPYRLVEIPSVNSWISEFAEELRPGVECKLLPKDQGITADPFWLKFVLSTLIQNGFLHGKPPVVVHILEEAGKVKIGVQDQGYCEFSLLSQMTEPFVKSSKSKGMGLGLNIVKLILDDWGVSLQYSKEPTTFFLILNKPGRV